MVLGSRSKEGNSTNVDFLDCLGDSGSRDFRDGLVERVEVANDHGNSRDLLGGEVGEVGRNVTRENTWGKPGEASTQ